MEIKVDRVIIKESGIYSFVGNSKSIKKDLMNKIIDNLNEDSPKTKVGITYSNPYQSFNNDTIFNNLANVLRIYDYSENYIDERVLNSFKILELDNKYFDKKINDLDYNEAKQISLTSALIHNPKVIILEDYTDTLTSSDKKELSRLLRRLKNKYNKIILLFTKDTQFSYEISDYVYLLDKDNIVAEGDKYIFKNISLVNKLGLEVPKIIKFISECNKNNHEISYYTSILDLIKAVYRDIK